MPQGVSAFFMYAHVRRSVASRKALKQGWRKAYVTAAAIVVVAGACVIILSSGTHATTAEGILRYLQQVKDIPPKIGEPQFDKSAEAIIEKGTTAGPVLVNQITNDSPSRVVDCFQYKIGDVAHRLLCELYKEPFLWPLEGRQPLDPGHGLSFMDYQRFVSGSEGREKLRELWQSRIGPER
jgi:hypothetical protein